MLFIFEKTLILFPRLDVCTCLCKEAGVCTFSVSAPDFSNIRPENMNDDSDLSQNLLIILDICACLHADYIVFFIIKQILSHVMNLHKVYLAIEPFWKAF